MISSSSSITRSSLGCGLGKNFELLSHAKTSSAKPRGNIWTREASPLGRTPLGAFNALVGRCSEPHGYSKPPRSKKLFVMLTDPAAIQTRRKPRCISLQTSKYSPAALNPLQESPRPAAGMEVILHWLISLLICIVANMAPQQLKQARCPGRRCPGLLREHKEDTPG